MRKYLLLMWALLSAPCYPLHIDIISSFNINDLPTSFPTTRQAFDVRSPCPSDYFVTLAPDDPDLMKIIVFDPWFNRDVISRLPKDKLILFLWEPECFPPEQYRTYSRVYTWDDRLVDNIKFFRFNYPYLMDCVKSSLDFHDKKLCTLVVGNWTQPRLDILYFFDTTHPEALTCYGRCPPTLHNPSLYKGSIPGSHSGQQKIAVLSESRFCICFENTIGLPGYITEKIFGCFAAGCVPIYWGASNIEDYIPKTCFIDYRDFQHPAELYHFLSTMTEAMHQEYLSAIHQYVHSEEASLFSPQFFDQLLYKAITSQDP